MFLLRFTFVTKWRPFRRRRRTQMAAEAGVSRRFIYPRKNS